MKVPALKSRSLVLRLTAAYLAAAAAVLLVSSLALYWTLASNLAKVELRLLDQKIDLFVEDQASEPGDDEELFKQLSVGSQGHDLQGYWVRFLDQAGRSTFETPGMDRWLPSGSFPQADPGNRARAAKRVVLSDGKVFRLRSAWSTAHGQPQREIQIALDCHGDEELLEEYRGQLLLVVLLGLVILAGLSILIARKGLRPLNDLGTVLRDQSAESLSIPLVASEWPVETLQVIEGYNDLSLRLHDSFKRLSQFSADLAHELRTPIHNLRLQADVILARPRKGADYKKALEAAQEEYGRLTRMTESLLFLARAENGKQVVTLAPLQAKEVLQGAARQFKALAEQKKLKISVQGSGPLFADLSLLQLALGNLLANACAHTPAKGRVLLSVKRLENAWVRLGVKDSGEGIATKDLPHVLDRFFRGDPARSKSEGSGLGLSIVAAIMALHHGKISIESDPGRSTQVWLDFPQRSMGQGAS